MSAGLRWSEEQWAAHRGRSLKPASAPRKYRNAPTVEDGLEFDSRKEARRWRELRTLLRAGDIAWLARQVDFILPGATIYRADFVYQRAGQVTVEDVKSDATRKLAAYRIKVRLMLACQGIQIQEV